MAYKAIIEKRVNQLIDKLDRQMERDGKIYKSTYNLFCKYYAIHNAYNTKQESLSHKDPS